MGTNIRTVMKREMSKQKKTASIASPITEKMELILDTHSRDYTL